MRTHFKKYAQQVDSTYRMKDYKAADTLFHNFISDHLIDSKFTNFKAKKLNGKLINIDSYFKKPIVLITYASWCVRNEEEITRLNNLATELHNQIDFVILFWDDYKTARKSSKKINKHITVLYINERENIYSKEVTTLKHTLGYPLTLYINNEKLIVDISKKSPHYQIYDSNSAITNFQNGLSALLVNSETSSNTKIVKQ